MSKQPRDDGNVAIPVLGLRPNTGQRLTISSSATRSAAFSAPTRVISVFSTDDCYIEIGSQNVEANISNSHFIPAGIYLDFSLGDSFVPADNQKYLSVIGVSGILYISERS